jgi:FtsH-binding integral membrane protein
MSMDYNRYEGTYTNDVAESSVTAVLMRKVYLWMTLALAITGFTSYYILSSPGILTTLFTGSAPLILIIVELALVVGLVAGIRHMSLTTATLLFAGYSVLNGITLTPLLLAYTGTAVCTAFFTTAGTFAATSLYGYVTRKDLTSIGSFLFMGLIGIIIATLVNIFLKSSGLQMIINYLGVAIFLGLTAYDTQKTKAIMRQMTEVNDSAMKIAVMCAFSLYLDFINLFIYLLRILGSRRN